MSKTKMKIGRADMKGVRKY